ncbi:MAG: hypothetical protein WCX27_02485 [Candidatus Paceibacterota bacterium]|jgi:predicted GH43/DUF377 family glycosyl hydrolase
MLKKPKNKKEIVHPIGFLQDLKTPSIFCRTDNDPEKIFLISNKKRSLFDFSKTKKRVFIKTGSKKLFDTASIENIVSSNVEKKEIITFTYSGGKRFAWALKKGVSNWIVLGDTLTMHEKGGIVPGYSHNKKHVLYFGESSIRVAYTKDLRRWTRSEEPVLRPRPGFFDHEHIKFIASKHTEKGIVVFYDASFKDGENIKLQVGAAMFSSKDPEKIIWRSDQPLFEQDVLYEKGLECKGALFTEDLVYIYWYSPKRETFGSSVIIPFTKLFTVKPFDKTKRNPKNPIIHPKTNSWWRSIGTFNPAAVEIEGKTHIFFRAIGSDGISRIGHAVASDGLHVDEVSSEPVFYLKQSHFGMKAGDKRYDPTLYPSGGSWGGTEDPRVVKIGKRIYMTFNAFDTWDDIRVGLVSIKESDVIKKRWNWSIPQLISPRGRAKNWIFFPEKIHGKYALLHNLYGKDSDHILIEYLDNIEMIDPKKMNFKSPDPQQAPNKPIAWHVHMRSVGPTPIKTDDGWLVLYHAHDALEGHRYKVGAMLLDLDDPTKVIARSSLPILVPDMWYENDWKPGIVYAGGAVVKNNTLFIYYGGGDKYVCVATVPMKDLLYSLKKDKRITPFINKVIIS